MTKEELDKLRQANLLEEKIKDTTKIEEKGSYKSNIRINKDAYPFIIDAL